MTADIRAALSDTLTFTKHHAPHSGLFYARKAGTHVSGEALAEWRLEEMPLPNIRRGKNE